MLSNQVSETLVNFLKNQITNNIFFRIIANYCKKIWISQKDKLGHHLLFSVTGASSGIKLLWKLLKIG